MTPQSSEDQLADLRQRAERAHLPTDPDQLEGELERLRAQLIPLGLHVFGSHWDAGEVAYMVAGVIGNGVATWPAMRSARSRAAVTGWVR